MRDTLARLEREALACEACPRLVSWRCEISARKKRATRDEPYWARPVPAFGGGDARLLVVGLAPGAHGANRTGRPFTGDGAGPFLYGALHRAGLASRPLSEARDDGLELTGVRITNAVRCVPPENKPTREELAVCGRYLAREIALLPRLETLLCLGGLAWNAVLRALSDNGVDLPRPRPKFGHGAEADLGSDAPYLVGAYHPSQLNTRTGRLTESMFDEVLARALAARAG